MMDLLPELPPNHEDQAALPRSRTNVAVKMANSSVDSARLLGEANSHLGILYLTSRNLPCTRAHIGRRFLTSRDVGLCCSSKTTVRVGCGSIAETLRPPVHRNGQNVVPRKVTVQNEARARRSARP